MKWRDRKDKKESQNIEWKEVWKDEYLKRICGMANAQVLVFILVLMMMVGLLDLQMQKSDGRYSK